MSDHITIVTEILRSLISSDNSLRSKAEETLQKEYAQSQPDILFSIRSLAAVLLRRIALQPTFHLHAENQRIRSCQFLDIALETRNSILAELLNALSVEPLATVRKKLCDCISELAKALLAKNITYPNLYSAVFQCLQSPHPEFRESGFRILSAVPRLLVQEEALDLTPILPHLMSSLSETEMISVKMMALTSAVNLLIEASVYAKHGFTELMIQMLNVLPYLFTLKDETNLTEAFTSLIDLATSVPTLFPPILPKLVEFSITIFHHTELETKTKHSNLELLLTLVDEAPKMVRKHVPDLARQLIPICLEMMADLEDQEEWHCTDILEDMDDHQENHVVGEQSLDRLARKLGAKYVTQHAFQYIQHWIHSPHWAQRHAALLAISAIGEGCHSLMQQELQHIVDRVVSFTLDPHPRVRHAACNCIGQLSTDFAPSLQHQYHAKILPALMGCMDNEGHPRVQAHGAAALINFCDHVERTDLEVYLDALFTRLVRLSQSEKVYVKEQAITTLATVADAAQTSFIPYYSSVMPALIQILSTTPNEKPLRTLRGKAVECATLIAMAVQKPVFQNDASRFLEVLAHLQSQVTEPDDPQVRYLLHAWTRLCQVLEHDFLPYLPSVMPPLLHSANLQPDLAFLDPEDQGQEYAAEDGWEQTVVEGQRLCIRTTPLDEKHTALEMVLCYARNLGTGFAPYACQVLDLILPLFEFYFHDGVRQAAMAAFPYVLHSLALQPEVQVRYFQQGFEKCMQLLPMEMDVEFTFQSLSSLQACLIGMQSHLQPMHLNCLFQVMAALINEFHSRIKERVDRYKEETGEVAVISNTTSTSTTTPTAGTSPAITSGNQDARALLTSTPSSSSSSSSSSHSSQEPDQDEDEWLEEEEEMENNVLSEITKLVQTLFKLFHVQVLPYFEALILPLFPTLLREQDSALLLLVFTLISDVIEYTGEACGPFLSFFMEPLVHGLTHSKEPIRQTCAYAIGNSVYVPSFHPLCTLAIPYLITFVQHPQKYQEGHIYDTENAVAAMAKFLRASSLFPSASCSDSTATTTAAKTTPTPTPTLSSSSSSDSNPSSSSSSSSSSSTSSTSSTPFVIPSDYKDSLVFHFILGQPVIHDAEEAPLVAEVFCDCLDHLSSSSSSSSTFSTLPLESCLFALTDYLTSELFDLDFPGLVHRLQHRFQSILLQLNEVQKNQFLGKLSLEQRQTLMHKQIHVGSSTGY